MGQFEREADNCFGILINGQREKKGEGRRTREKIEKSGANISWEKDSKKDS